MGNIEKINQDSSDLLEIAKKLEGIPYEHNGRNYEGVDCWGVVYLFFKEIGIEFPLDDGDYISDEWYKKDPGRYERSLQTLGEEVGHYKNLLPLDIPYYNLYRDVITHTSVMLDKIHFIHVLIDKEVAIDTMKRRYWRKKYKGARRIDVSKYI